jgi:DNA-directed RNA polymerase subunit beta'
MKESILELEKSLLKLENLHASFDYLRIRIASPKRIRSWSERTLPNGEVVGEILRPETINFRTHQPEIYGLFCEKIFGPTKNWRCKCGKYNGFSLDKICDECHVEITESRVRRYRMGYIDLACPIAHIWYLKGIPNYLSLILQCFNPKITTSKIEQMIYFRALSSNLFKNSSLLNPNEKCLNELDPFLCVNNERIEQSFILKNTGSTVIKDLLENIDLYNEIKKIRSLSNDTLLKSIKSNQEINKLEIRRIRILESFLSTNTNPSWMILTSLPVLPPTLRPLAELESGKLVAADINEIYRLIITRNQRLKDFLRKNIAPDLINIQARKLLQEGVDALIDNARLPANKIFCLNNKPLKSLTETLEGKQGRFRQSLLGKRVDYSGRSVIIVGPSLRLNQCGLPYDMASELFQPFLIKELLKLFPEILHYNTKIASVILKKNKPLIWKILEKLTNKYCILLNRAPTLHRFGIQAFNPVLVLGQAIHLHPLVCAGFNADFDGDQMAVHLPIYSSSQLEAKTMMRPSHNILSSSNGEVILRPTQDMVIGSYYLTFMAPGNISSMRNWFSNEIDALGAFYQKKLDLHTPILVRYAFIENNAYIHNNELIFSKENSRTFNKKVYVYKIYRAINNKRYLITNIGIFIDNLKKEYHYNFSHMFFETTPGRIIFSTNLKNLINKE